MHYILNKPKLYAVLKYSPSAPNNFKFWPFSFIHHNVLYKKKTMALNEARRTNMYGGNAIVMTFSSIREYEREHREELIQRNIATKPNYWIQG